MIVFEVIKKLPEIDENIKAFLNSEDFIIKVQISLKAFIPELLQDLNFLAPSGDFDNTIFDDDKIVKLLEEESFKKEYWEKYNISYPIVDNIKFTMVTFANTYINRGNLLFLNVYFVNNEFKHLNFSVDS